MIAVMIRLTVLYNLAPGTDEAAFVRWRLSVGQVENAGKAGVVRTDFGIVDHAWPPGTHSPYKYMTTADWPDMASFHASFYASDEQAQLMKDIDQMSAGGALFLVTEILVETVNPAAEA